MRSSLLFSISTTIITVVLSAALFAIEAPAQEIVPLPAPRIRSGVMRALQDRATIRAYDPAPLSRQTISEVCWASFGVTDPATGRRTAASAFGAKEIVIYAITAEGAYRYDPHAPALVRVAQGDVRAPLGTQAYALDAPLTLIYVADYNRSRVAYPDWAEQNMEFYTSMQVGLSMQNVHLYCAARGLATVIRDVVNKEELGKTLGLIDGEEILISQPVGKPKR